MMPNVDPSSPLFTLRIPKLRLEPTPTQEVRDAIDALMFTVAWGLVRVGFWLSRRFEPCDVCPQCGPYPVVDHDGKCGDCGSEIFNTEDTREFR